MSFGKYTFGTPKIIWNTENAKLVVGNFCSTYFSSIKLSFPINVTRNHLSRQDSFLEISNCWVFNSFLSSQYLFNQYLGTN